MTNGKIPRLIAFYLPQYHPIPENDEWWGKGFTEWTNVAKAKPLFKGHYQPRIPADLGFYDLRVPEVREAQAELAREAGIEGFCYWHYWFAGRQLLERPFREVLESGKPDFPFCLAWANHSFTGVWHGAPDRILIEQTYPGFDDDKNHFYSLLPALTDDRYMKVDGKPIIVIFQPTHLPDYFLELWQNLALSAGLKGLFMVGIIKNKSEGSRIQQLGFDACSVTRTDGRGYRYDLLRNLFLKTLGEKQASSIYQKLLKKPFHIYAYKQIRPFISMDSELEIDEFPCIMPNWDNTPRTGLDGYVFKNASPEIFQEHLREAIKKIEPNEDQHKIIIVKSWNEWAEGNHLEPDTAFGQKFLNAVRNELDNYQIYFSRKKIINFSVSVIIPVYNAASYVTQAVESALEQPEVVEIILVEDGSPDNSLQVCQSLAEKHGKVCLYQHPDGVNRGAAPSRNLGIEKSTCPFIAFLDADDFYLPGRFSKTLERFESNPNYDGVYEAVGIYFEDKQGKERWLASNMASVQMTTMTRYVHPEDLFKVLMKGGSGHIHLNGLVIKRAILKNSGTMNETIANTYEDTDFVLKLAAVGKLIPGRLSSSVAIRRVHSENRISAQRSANQIYQDRMKMRKAMYQWCKGKGYAYHRKLVFNRMMEDYLRDKPTKSKFFNHFPDFIEEKLKLLLWLFEEPVVVMESSYWKRLL